jgi:hypothetical protein
MQSYIRIQKEILIQLVRFLYYYEFAYANLHRNAVFERLASQQENLYKNRCCDINKENVQMKHFIYK